MNVEMRKTGDLIPYENNPRKNDNAVEAVANSIKEFGFKVPIIIDKEGVIVAGHTRLKAAEVLGIEEVPVVVANDLTEEQIKAFRLVENKTNELASWDFEKLDMELNDIIDVDMSDFGFLDFSDHIDGFFTEDEPVEVKEVESVDIKYLLECKTATQSKQVVNLCKKLGIQYSEA